MKTEIEKVVKEKYPDNMKYGVEYQMDDFALKTLEKHSRMDGMPV